MRLAEMISGMTPDRLAALAPFVLAAADEGVPRAIEICRRAIEHLTDLVRVLDIGDGDTLYAIGGLATCSRPASASGSAMPLLCLRPTRCTAAICLRPAARPGNESSARSRHEEQRDFGGRHLIAEFSS